MTGNCCFTTKDLILSASGFNMIGSPIHECISYLIGEWVIRWETGDMNIPSKGSFDAYTHCASTQCSVSKQMSMANYHLTTMFKCIWTCFLLRWDKNQAIFSPSSLCVRSAYECGRFKLYAIQWAEGSGQIKVGLWVALLFIIFVLFHWWLLLNEKGNPDSCLCIKFVKKRGFCLHYKNRPLTSDQTTI